MTQIDAVHVISHNQKTMENLNKNQKDSNQKSNQNSQGKKDQTQTTEKTDQMKKFPQTGTGSHPQKR